MLKVAQFCKKYNVLTMIDFMPITEKIIIAFYSVNRHESHTFETTLEDMQDPNFEDILLKQVMDEMHFGY